MYSGLRRPAALLACLPALVGCAPKGVAFSEAAALEAQGRLPESATAYELVCVREPASAAGVCRDAAAKAAALRVRAADAAVAAGKHQDAQKQILLGLAAAEPTEVASLEEQLARPDLAAALRWERALALGPEGKRLAEAEAIAAGEGPAAARAKEWLGKDRRERAVRAAELACGPSREGSCSEAAAQLKDAGPDADAAKRLASSEASRIAPLLVEAERFLKAYELFRLETKHYEKCVASNQDIPDEGTIISHCNQVTWPRGSDRRHRDRDLAFRSLLRQIGDPAIAKDLEARSGLAVVVKEGK